jgi:uncharacterized protein (TIGR04255 family)
MARLRSHLNNAPITEAVVDFRVRPRDGLNVSDFSAAAERFAPGYTKQGPIFHVQAMIAVDTNSSGPSGMSSSEIGLRMHSTDQRYVMQLQREGFSLSRLSPYETWEALVTEARRLWEIYVEVARPVAVWRVATRYINNLRLPMQDGEDFSVYLTKPPEIPEGLPQSLSSFLQRVVMHDKAHDVHATVTQIFEPIQLGNLPTAIPVILDVDAFRVAEFQIPGQGMWNCLQELRNFKNLVFFESLTEKAIELYA